MCRVGGHCLLAGTDLDCRYEAHVLRVRDLEVPEALLEVHDYCLTILVGAHGWRPAGGRQAAEEELYLGSHDRSSALIAHLDSEGPGADPGLTGGEADGGQGAEQIPVDRSRLRHRD
jgi:hypothetical protein